MKCSLMVSVVIETMKIIESLYRHSLIDLVHTTHFSCSITHKGNSIDFYSLYYFDKCLTISDSFYLLMISSYRVYRYGVINLYSLRYHRL